jgi:hypothetical protein
MFKVEYVKRNLSFKNASSMRAASKTLLSPFRQVLSFKLEEGILPSASLKINYITFQMKKALDFSCQTLAKETYVLQLLALSRLVSTFANLSFRFSFRIIYRQISQNKNYNYMAILRFYFLALGTGFAIKPKRLISPNCLTPILS